MEQSQYAAIVAERAMRAIAQDLEIAIQATPTGPRRERLTEINIDVMRLQMGDETPRSEAQPDEMQYPEEYVQSRGLVVEELEFDTPAPELYHQEKAILYAVYHAIQLAKGECSREDLIKWGFAMEDKLRDHIGQGEASVTSWQSLVWTAGYNAASQ